MNGLLGHLWDLALAQRLLLAGLDIAVVSFLLYRVILLIRGTRTVQMLAGLTLLMGLLYVSQKIGLPTLHWITNNFFSSIVLVIFILFQNDIRSALSQVGYGSFFSAGSRPKQTQLIQTLAAAAQRLSADRVGALMVIERRIGLRNYISLGVTLDAQPTPELLAAIFDRHSPIHDGAVIIQNGRLATAGCFLPLSSEPSIDRNLGTRHRAALGISQESDALVLVVSEETGAISLVSEGRIHYDIDKSDVPNELARMLGVAVQPAPIEALPEKVEA